ncbi:acyltransferase family protein [Flavobacterium psychrotolerans]|uniref:DUF5009 domain-containing protein n=1 Tax=Flavobacterium psychrotolerans TaxID=2169410 RepID=A0A2U1JQX2_9FLAO|nr:DUF5009 domain-containing protein [Flavobacterium psychrotolerans]PWA07415.1 DUF5009 domain-containing protein [Flavobacterium psychrotolerans]
MTKERLQSLDVFRGITILYMTLVNNPGSWSFIYPPLEHAEWNGCTPADLVFPFFIFIMGTAIPFAIPDKTLENSPVNKIVVRSLRIFCLGLFLNFFSNIELFGLDGISLLFIRLTLTLGVSYALLGNFNLKVKTFLVFTILTVLLFLSYGGIKDFQEVRVLGVLQRLGIVYFFVAVLYLKTTRKIQLLVAITLLLGYWVVMAMVPVPGIGSANFEKGTNMAAWLDGLLLKGHMWIYTKTWDPEGLLSTVPAIASGIIGLLIGQLMNITLPKLEIVKKIILIGVTSTVIGILWGIIFPINKSLWTSSYVLYTSGLAILCLTFLYYTVEIANYKKWTLFFIIWGVNPMIVFFYSGIVSKVLRMIKIQNPEIVTEQISIQDYFYKFWITPTFSNPLNASLAFALINTIFWSLILCFFYKNKLIFKV